MPDVATLIISAAQAQGVDPRLALEVAIAESNLNQAAVSAKGAIGVMGLMPATARDLGVDPYKLEENIRGGVRYLKQQLARFGDTAAALAAYNCGPGCVAQAMREHGAAWLSFVPAETRAYVPAILSRLRTEYSVAVTPGGVLDTVVTAAEQAGTALAQRDPQAWQRAAVLIGFGLLLYFTAREISS